MNLSGASGLVLAVGLASLVAGDGAAVDAAAPAPAITRAAWSETAWPFLRDQWSAGQALRCDAAQCGIPAQLYLRSKVGFCDCFNHVEDDDDIDRLTDFDLIGGDRVVPLGPGRRLALAAGPARLREFRLEDKRGEVRHAVAVVLAVDCQARIAMLVSPLKPTPATEAAALELLDDHRGALRDASAAATNQSDETQ
jgi:hypothetical protein